MASIRKLTWTTQRGKRTTKWQLTYYDRDGNRVRKNFAHKDDADRERIRVEGQLEAGTHIADRNSRTVLEACRAWLDHVEDLVKVGKRERQTHRPYRNHVDLVIAKHDIAAVKLSRLTTPTCQLFVDQLEKSVSRARLRKVLRSLRMALNFAARRGWIAGNPAAQAKADTIDRAKEEVEIPEKTELRALLLAASVFDDTGYAEAFVTTKLFSGLRISELRGLPKAKGLHLFDNMGPKIRVLQRADERGRIGPPKSRTSRRTVPVGPATVHALQRWLPKAPAGDFGLVFPNGAGNVESYANIYHRLWMPLCVVAGVVKNPSARKSKQRPKYGPHSLRHAYASMLIEQGLSPKQVQHRMGHASLQMTMDLYGHLWPDPDADRRSAQATERIILGAG